METELIIFYLTLNLTVGNICQNIVKRYSINKIFKKVKLLYFYKKYNLSNRDSFDHPKLSKTGKGLFKQ